MLADWFEAPVVLTSSGRAAVRLALADLGLSRYRDRLAVSAMTAACVFDAVIRHAFPVDPADAPRDVSATLLIQQYGFVQSWRPDGPVIEDICHGFYATPDSGARNWAGDTAVFSLPKFFSVAGMAGGIVARTAGIADRLREWAQAAIAEPAEAATDRAVFQDLDPTAAELEAMYLRRLLTAGPDAASLAGLPDLAGLRAAGAVRRGYAERIMATARARSIPDDWRRDLAQQLPFALPVFGDRNALRPIDDRLADAGISCGIYQIDRSRDNRRPEWTSALLVPCHQFVREDQMTAIEGALAA